ncbi:MAG TPA: endonuclease domain-containing protein [Rhizomicrobium sp.]|jgi:very-short-patch-repair endonuclease|nr:endonuclease domain-containing protein [Rhizomicrobium sp.]
MAQQRKADCVRRKTHKRPLAKLLRANATDAERILWSILRGKQLADLRFRRQQPIGPYIADFFCPSAKLIVELDGSQHGADKIAAYDEERTRFLESKGYRVIRFWNIEVMKDRDSVAEAIFRAGSEPDPSPKSSSR